MATPSASIIAKGESTKRQSMPANPTSPPGMCCIRRARCAFVAERISSACFDLARLPRVPARQHSATDGQMSSVFSVAEIDGLLPTPSEDEHVPSHTSLLHVPEDLFEDGIRRRRAAPKLRASLLWCLGNYKPNDPKFCFVPPLCAIPQADRQGGPSTSSAVAKQQRNCFSSWDSDSLTFVFRFDLRME